MSGFFTEVKRGIQKLRTQPGHSAVVIVTLGLALGLSAVIFSFVSFFLLRPLPVRDEKTMVLARSTHPQHLDAAAINRRLNTNHRIMVNLTSIDNNANAKRARPGGQRIADRLLRNRYGN